MINCVVAEEKEKAGTPLLTVPAGQLIQMLSSSSNEPLAAVYLVIGVLSCTYFVNLADGNVYTYRNLVEVTNSCKCVVLKDINLHARRAWFKKF